MFDNIGSKVKTMAKVFCGIGIGSSIILGIVSIFTSNFFVGLLIAALGSFVSWISTLALYAIGEASENTNIILRKIKKIETNQTNQIKTTESEIQTNQETPMQKNENNSSKKWWCSCGAENKDIATTCSVCFKQRPSNK